MASRCALERGSCAHRGSRLDCDLLDEAGREHPRPRTAARGLLDGEGLPRPKGKFATVDRFTSQDTPENTPITEIVVNSLVTNVTEARN